MDDKMKNDAKSIAIAFKVIFKRLKKENKKQEDKRMEFAIGQKVVREATKEVFIIREVRVLKEGIFYFVEENSSCFSESCFKGVIDISMEELNTGDLVVCKENTVWKVLKDTAWGDVYVTRTSMGVVTRTELDIIDVISPIYKFQLLDDFMESVNL